MRNKLLSCTKCGSTSSLLAIFISDKLPEIFFLATKDSMGDWISAQDLDYCPRCYDDIFQL